MLRERMEMKSISKQQFFSVLAPSSIIVRLQGSPVLPSVRLAYSYLKSNGVVIAWNNFLAEKVGDGQLSAYWQGDYINETTKELRQLESSYERKELRSYRTIYHAFKDEDALYKLYSKHHFKLPKNLHDQVKALVRLRSDDVKLVEQLIDFISLYQLENYDNIHTLYDMPPTIHRRELIPVMYQEELFSVAFVIDDSIYISLRKMQEQYVLQIDKRNGILRISGHYVKSISINQICYVSLEDLKRILFFYVEWDHYAKVLFLS